jgi:hypothetical protein
MGQLDFNVYPAPPWYARNASVMSRPAYCSSGMEPPGWRRTHCEISYTLSPTLTHASPSVSCFATSAIVYPVEAAVARVVRFMAVGGVASVVAPALEAAALRGVLRVVAGIVAKFAVCADFFSSVVCFVCRVCVWNRNVGGAKVCRLV